MNSAATLAVAALTWSDPRDIPALAAGLLGTWGMFMLRGIAMRGARLRHIHG
ncbi:YgjV family protein [Halomonas sp. 25-S5]|uniref:YgjV family protein n=1 Tax=Halomonas sp. 25-S5 TaxID=2994065 RepID=UPI002468BC49|nr:YgjV family protein [Halomonas sp. 25-S5]